MGDGSNTFNVIDKRGRLSAGKDDMGGSAASRITNAGSGIVGTTLGASGGAQSVALARANLPNETVTVTITDPGHSHQQYSHTALGGVTGGGNAVDRGANSPSDPTGSATTGISASFNLNGGISQTNVNKMPPTVVVNYLLRIF